jgi:enterochelin esterase-like enzyme
LPEPQSTAFFLLLIVVFAGLMWWMAVAKQVVFRILAACLAFLPAMAFGVAAVNKYYDYYQNWNSVISDVTGQDNQATEVPSTDTQSGAALSTFLGSSSVDQAVAAQFGYTAHLDVTGQITHITRSVYVYLPPQYFQPAYRNYRFPAIELLHGFPGTPQDWITVVGVTSMMQELISTGQAKPAVLVMPDANGGRTISLQCLNQYKGPEDATYLAVDLPNYISQRLRVQPPGQAWGIAGYSEGGFCAANLGLKYGDRFGFSGVLSGYFVPLDNQFGNRMVSPFGGNTNLRLDNTPDHLVLALPPGTKIPQFWLGVGAADYSDYQSAQVFEQLVQTRQPGVVLKVVSGGGHTMFTWRSLMPPLLEWMTPQLAQAASAEQARQAHAAERAAAHAPAAAHKRAHSKAAP